MVDALNNVDNNLARRVAFGVGVELPKKVIENDNQTTVGISIEKYPKADNIKTRTVAILTAPRTNTNEACAMYDYLKKEGAYPGFIGLNIGTTDSLNITDTYLTTSSVLWDAVYVPSGTNVTMKTMASRTALFPYEEPKMFIMDAFRHGKPIAASGQGTTLLEIANIDLPDRNDDMSELDGVILVSVEYKIESAFKKVLIQQRYWSRLPLDDEM